MVTGNSEGIRTLLAIVLIMEEAPTRIASLSLLADNGKNLLCVCEILRYDL